VGQKSERAGKVGKPDDIEAIVICTCYMLLVGQWSARKWFHCRGGVNQKLLTPKGNLE